MGKLVSAIIITHNRRELVEKAYRSVKQQDYCPMEIIVVDDASEDGTKEYFEGMVDPQLRYFYISREESRGGNHARNVGICQARGEYLAFLDDDDEWMPTKTGKQVAVLDSRPEVGIVSSIKMIQRDFTVEYPDLLKNYPQTEDMHTEIFNCTSYTTSCMMMRKQILEEIGMFDEQLRYWQEYDLLIRLAQVTLIARIDEPLTLYRIIRKDKNRLTNRLEGWEKAVEYINHKYEKQISALPEEEKKRRNLMIWKDGAMRADICHYRKMKRYYLRKIYEQERTPVDFIKMVLGIRQIRGNK